MSLPVGDAEWARYNKTADQAGPAENIVSTACPDCGTRFAMLAKFRASADGPPQWRLRCVNCGSSYEGDLKE